MTTAAVTAAHHAVALLKGITEKVKSSGKSEGLSDFIDVQMAMIELIEKHHEQILENVQLREKIRELEAAQKARQELFFEEKFGWYYTKKDGKEDAQFCAKCYDGSQRFARLHQANPGSDCQYFCRICDAAYG